MTRGAFVLLVCAGLAACDRAAPAAGEPQDAPALDAASADAPPRRWSPPTPVPGVNSSSNEDDPSYTADRLTIVFISSRNGNDDEIFIGTRPDPDGDFTVALVEALSSPSDEASPEISPDGTTLYFVSDRAGSDDIFVSARPPGGVFGAPTLVAELSTSASEGDIAISPDGLTAVIARSGAFLRSTRPTTTDGWSTPISITGVAFGTSPAAPSIDGAGDLYFHAGSNRDLFVARAQGASYATPMAISELQSSSRESGPCVSPDESFMMFARGGQIVQSIR